MDTVSIIIINYNGAHHIEENLNSLKALDYPLDKIELIVYDNGSSDGSVDLIRKLWPSAVIIENESNAGFAAPHRAAAERAKGDVLALLNNDMRVDPLWLTEGCSLLNRSEKTVCASSKIMKWDGEGVDYCGGTLQYLGFADQLEDQALKNGESILFPCGGAMFIYRDVFLDAGCFDGDYFAIFEDVDLGWRLWVAGYNVVMATRSLVYHKGHGTLDTRKESKKRYLMHRNAMMTIIKNYDDENLNRILPLALIFSVKRALLFMGVNKSSFYFWEEEPSAEERVPDNYDEACIHLAALDDVFSSFSALTRKRKRVQMTRKRRDSEIFELFRDPFRNIMGYHEYLWDEVSLFGKFGLERVFSCQKEHGRRIEDGHFHARQMLDDMIRKCRENNFMQEGHDSEQPYEPTSVIAGKLIARLKDDGPVLILKKLVKRLFL